jgi:hypothetical protein
LLKDSSKRKRTHEEMEEVKEEEKNSVKGSWNIK